MTRSPGERKRRQNRPNLAAGGHASQAASPADALYCKLVALLRITSLVMSLALGFAPVARDVCQATCALHAIATKAMSSAAPASHEHHSPSRPDAHSAAPATSSHQHPAACHDAVETPSVVTGQALQGVPHTCSHSDDLPASAAASPQQALAPPAIIATTLVFAVPDAGRGSWREPVPTPVPLRIAVTTPLRV